MGREEAHVVDLDGPHPPGGSTDVRVGREAVMSDGALITAELRLAGRLDARFFALLEALERTGSINRAARTAGLSYKGAWLLLEAACNLANEPLLETSTGGAGGGGTRITTAARGLLEAWRTLQSEHREFLRAQEARLAHLPALEGLLRRMSMKTTARNQFAGTVKAVDAGPVSAQVTIALKSGDEIVATVTSAAARRLKLKKGQEALALIKASAVVLVTDFAGWQLSARNQLAGTVSRIDKGAVSSLVVLTLPGGPALTASVTNEGVEALGLKVGVAATAVFKAYAVMVATQG
jgi:molybdate transport system regulatory protein